MFNLTHRHGALQPAGSPEKRSERFASWLFSEHEGTSHRKTGGPCFHCLAPVIVHIWHLQPTFKFNLKQRPGWIRACHLPDAHESGQKAASSSFLSLPGENTSLIVPLTDQSLQGPFQGGNVVVAHAHSPLTQILIASER